jgi:hypothetical protein
MADLNALWQEYQATQQNPALGNAPQANIAQTPVGQIKSFESNVESEKAIEDARNKAIVDREAEFLGKAEGARNFLSKTPSVMKQIEGVGSGFGTWDNSELGTAVNRVFAPSAVGRKEALQGDLSDLELDLVKAKMKGQGTITETERAIARQTLPNLKNVDAETAANILRAREAEAKRILKITEIYNSSGMPYSEFERALNEGKITIPEDDSSGWTQTKTGAKYRVIK